MRTQINLVSRRKKGGVSKKTQVLDQAIIKIGRGTDQAISLADLKVAYEHAYIFQGEDGAFYVEAKALSGIRFNRKPASSERLSPGDTIGIGGYELTVQAATDEFDLILDVEQVETDDRTEAWLLEDAKINLEKAGLRKRFWSWVLFAGILVLFLVVPMVASFVKPVQQALNSVPFLPSDSVWGTGELDSAHHFFKEDCKFCHKKPFIRVEDEACSGCHKHTHQHADPKFNAIETLNEARCASCHEEHNGSSGHLITRDDALCSDCHSKLQQLVGSNTKTQLIDVSDFGDDHPEFKPSIPVIEAGKDKLLRIDLSDNDNLKEHNTLLFSHKVHLNEKGVKNTQGKEIQLDCAACHIPDSGGVRMQPIKFEQFCSDCHRLDFDLVDTSRVLPHGDVKEVLYSLEDYYNTQALKGGYNNPVDADPAVIPVPEIVRRRRPGRVRLTSVEKKEALEWAAAKTKQVSMDVFKFRVCKTCHSIEYSSNATPPFTITPVRIPQHWMPLAQFNHARHLTMSCESCHDVENSEEGSDVLLPGIESCRNCHGGAHESKKLASTCIDCHGFHIGEGQLRDTPEAPVITTPVNDVTP